MKPVISIIMGSKSDWATMQKTAEVLDRFGVAYEKKVVSPTVLQTSCSNMRRKHGVAVSRSLLQVLEAQPICQGWLQRKQPFLSSVPVKSRALSGVDSLYSIVQMPGGVPVATMAIGEAGATNAALCPPSPFSR